MRLKDKIVVITGGTDGIGRGCAIAAAREGANVVVTGRNQDRGRTTVDIVMQQGGTIRYIEQDVTNESAWESLFKQVIDGVGSPDVLVNNAGDCILKPIVEYPVETLRYMLQMNIEACFMGTQRALKTMSEKGGGSIINMSSVAGLKGGPGGTAYGASKAAMTMFTKAAALEGAPHGVRVNSVHPGLIWGDGVIDSMGEDGAAKFREMIVARTPLKMVGAPDDIAGMVVFLASDESARVSGTEVVVDGGYMAV
ncbi:MAG: SDR family NAD(P)-dependent oxidoreductase [Proteobacteria bacterium]|nr:SDR family NAD(P)-dependent oxidoreductase [Pseudomonadota bacterium]MDA1059981.1 SDR family NAD(P)-dependent oxidoreductase [Pseudomonadota bacterium]